MGSFTGIVVMSGFCRAKTAASFAPPAATVPVAIWAASRIFKTGILMYGKRLSMRDVLLWLKAR